MTYIRAAFAGQFDFGRLSGLAWLGRFSAFTVITGGLPLLIGLS